MTEKKEDNTENTDAAKDAAGFGERKDGKDVRRAGGSDESGPSEDSRLGEDSKDAKDSANSANSGSAGDAGNSGISGGSKNSGGASDERTAAGKETKKGGSESGSDASKRRSSASRSSASGGTGETSAARARPASGSARTRKSGGPVGDLDTVPWYKEPWPWVLIALPGAVVIASFVTMYIAFTHKDTLVTDDYYKDGKDIHLQMERDQRAALLDVHASVFVQNDGKGVLVVTRGKYDKTAPLRLIFFHPTIAEKDRTVKLVQSEGNPFQYTGTFDHPLPFSVSWKLRLEDEEHVWRLDKRWITAEGNGVNMDPNMQILSNKALLERTKLTMPEEFLKEGAEDSEESSTGGDGDGRDEGRDGSGQTPGGSDADHPSADRVEESVNGDEAANGHESANGDNSGISRNVGTTKDSTVPGKDAGGESGSSDRNGGGNLDSPSSKAEPDKEAGGTKAGEAENEVETAPKDAGAAVKASGEKNDAAAGEVDDAETRATREIEQKAREMKENVERAAEEVSEATKERGEELRRELGDKLKKAAE